MDDKDDDFENEQEANANENHTRIDISNQITESLLIEISDKNWKTRNEGLMKLQGNCMLRSYQRYQNFKMKV